MARWKKALIFVAAGVGCVVALLWIGIDHLNSRTARTNDATTNFHQIKAEALEREIRNALPIGSSLEAVEIFLQKRGLEFSFEKSTKTIYAMARETKGSNLIIIESLGFQFHFDDELKLKSIESKVHLTGP